MNSEVETEKTQDTNELFAALAIAQGQFTSVIPDKNVSFRTKSGDVKYNYASLAVIIQMARKPLCDNGLSILQITQNGDLITMLAHKSGQYISSVIPLPDSSDIKQLGANLSYLRRYQYTSIIGVAIKGEDDESVVEGSIKPKPSQAQKPNRQLKPKPAKQEYTFPSKAAQDFFATMEEKSNNYWQGNAFHFSETMKKLGLSWSILNSQDDMEAAGQKLIQYASNRRDEKAALE